MGESENENGTLFINSASNVTGYFNPTAEPEANRSPLVSLTVPAIMFGMGVFGNALAILVLVRSPKEHRRTVFYRLVGGLAFTDLFGTCALSPVTLRIYANNLKWLGGQPLCDYFSFMMIFSGLATVFIIAAMAMDRYLALTKPYLYGAKITYQKAIYLLLLLWGMAFVIACLPLMGIGKNVRHFPGSWCFFDFNGETVNVKLFAYFYSILGLFVICSIFVLNVRVIVTLCQMRQISHQQNKKSQVRSMDTEIQMVIFLVGILAVFGLCYAPLMVRILIIQVAGDESQGIHDLMVIRLASFNQILDPWVYLLFRKELISRLRNLVMSNICNKTLRLSSPRKSFCLDTEVTKIKTEPYMPSPEHLQKIEQSSDLHDFERETLVVKKETV